MFRHQRLIALPALVLCLAAPAAAQEHAPLPPLAPYDSIGYYTVSWSGIDVGGMAIEAHEDDDSYRMEVVVKSKGLAWTFTKHSSTTTVEGVKNGKYIPQKFETTFNLRGKTRHILLIYGKRGELESEYNHPPEDPKKRPPVPMELKQYALDALTPFFTQRKRIYNALQNGEDRFSLRMFDGRRLSDMHYFIHGRKQVGWNMQDVPVIHFSLTRTPVAGYKKDELADFQKEKDPNVSLYLSDDGRLIPLKIVVDSSAGLFYANYQQNCTTMEACTALLK